MTEIGIASTTRTACYVEGKSVPGGGIMIMDDTEGRLNEWIAASDAATTHFSHALGLDASAIDIQGATVAKLELDDPVAILDQDWTPESLIELLKDVDFAAWSNVEYVTLTESILPLGTPRRLDEETIKMNGEQWRIHAYDPDPFPSLPHAHEISTGLKMDLRNGDIYRKRTIVSRLRPKELREFRKRVKTIPLPDMDVTS